jgi:GT2 family glycosyltransferase
MDSLERQCKVAVIVLNWNGRDITAECLESLQLVTYPNFEVILVDNGSADGSAEFFRRNYPLVLLLENGQNLGFAGGNNAGIKTALQRGADYVLLLNNDIIVDPDFLSQMVAAGEAHSEVGFLGPKIYYYDRPNVMWYAGGEISLRRGLSRHYGFGENDRGQYEDPSYVNFVTGCSLLVKCDAIRNIGFLDEAMFCYGEDADLCIRARKAGYCGYYVPAAKVWHKIGASKGGTFSLYMGTRNAMYLVRKHASTGSFVVFLLSFVSGWVLKNIIRSLLRGDYLALKNICAAFAAFLKMPSSQGWQADSVELPLRHDNKGPAS